MTAVAALGQLFSSMSLSVGVMITFGSYMKKDINIEKSARQIEVFDTLVAFLSGLMIVPAVYAMNEKATLYESGPSLIFVVLPRIFSTMLAGRLIGAAFFIMVFLAALTSAVSLMEASVSTFVDKFKLSRLKSCVAVLTVCLVFGALCALGYSALDGFSVFGMTVLDLFDFFSNSIMIPIVALVTCIFVGFVLKPKVIIDELEISGKFRAKKLFSFVTRYLAPIFILVILFSSVLSAFGVIAI
jgi:NSS family neurotransmitter:Na+ symporter